MNLGMQDLFKKMNDPVRLEADAAEWQLRDEKPQEARRLIANRAKLHAGLLVLLLVALGIVLWRMNAGA